MGRRHSERRRTGRAALLLRLRETRDLDVLLITHDLGSLGGVADRVVVLHHGRAVETGTTEEIFLAPRHPYTRLLVRPCRRSGTSSPPTPPPAGPCGSRYAP
ncbi:hypothetical protein AB0K18_09010 [Nonomuraea sp. NPDC049421]|uniref:hypothetical protein n=1 Tax=Nonomuraea sp. NPDC049421 TaxID=3155275 RepID=UPI003435FF9B